MSRKRRSPRSEPADDSRAEASETEPTEPRATPDDNTPSEATEQPASDAGAADDEQRIELPSFGFASDLLSKHRSGELATRAADESVDPDAEQAVDEAMLAAVAAEVDADGPGRIFDFADRVAATAFADDEEKKPRRLETWMSFSLADEIFAMPVAPVQQVVRVSAITRVPHAPRPIRGVMNLRGRVIPVIDLRLRVGLEATQLDRSARVVAIGSRGRVLGLLVDAVHQVTRIDIDQIQPPPDDVMTIQSDYIRGVYHQEEQLILLLDVDRALIIREEGAA
ncbi:MAG: chemotaxis protein CheW [Acidobacteriota bacterium]